MLELKITISILLVIVTIAFILYMTDIDKTISLSGLKEDKDKYEEIP